MCSSSDFSIFISVITFGLAVATFIVAYQQKKIAKAKLDLDLFEKRFAIYKATERFIGEIVTTARVSRIEQRKFLNGIKGARWLFSIELDDYLRNELFVNSTQFNHNQRKTYQDGVLDVSHDLFNWYSEQQRNLNKKFDKYLPIFKDGEVY